MGKVFDRRAAEPGAKADAGTCPPAPGETVQRAQRVGERSERGREAQQVGRRLQALLPWLGTVAAGIDLDRLFERRARSAIAGHCLGDYRQRRLGVGQLSVGTSLGVGPEPFGPCVKRRVGGRVLAAQIAPDDVTKRA